MFGQNKPAGFSGFGATPSSFGTFGASSSGFGGGSAFGTQAPASTSLFGSGASASAAPNLFGQPASTGFGQQPSTSGFSFGGATNNANPSGVLFGSTSQAGTGSFFSTPGSGSTFGAKPAGFGGFGGTTNQTSTSGIFSNSSGTPSLFGQPGGASAFGGGAGASAGGGSATLPFNPPSGQDTMMKSGVTTNINTRHNCITAMKEYENKSLEELRFEDYSANRKFKQTGSTATGGLFGQAPASQASNSGFVFGAGGGIGTGLQAGATGFSGFGSTSSAATTPFNQNRPMFGTATTTQSGFGLGAATGRTPQQMSLFGNAAKPMFGTPTSQASLTGGSSFFGAQPGGASASIGFGTNNQAGGAFGTKPAGFGTATTSGIGFGANLLFAKPAATASSFGFGTNTSTAGFGNTSGGGMFNLKPGGFGSTSTGLGTGSTFGFGAGLGGGTTSNAFGTTAAKPGGFGGFNFGTGAGAGGFGSTLGAGTGASTFTGLGGGGGLSLGTSTAAAQSNNAQMQQHLLALATSPYGDNPLFWNLNQQVKDRRDDVLKPTNPNAQKAVLTSANQYKVSPRPTAKMKPKSLHNLINGGKAQIFDGLEDEDFSFGDDTFVPRKSVKKLVLRKGQGNKSSDTSSFFSEPVGLYNSEGNTASVPHPITRPLDNNSHQEEGNEAEAKVPHLDTPTAKEPFVQRLFTNSSLDDSNNSVHNMSPRQDSLPMPSRLAADTTTSFLDTSDLDNSCLSTENGPPHPTGIVMTRPGYYCIPSLDEMTSLMDENGNCFVEDLTIGREGYGNLFFPGITNVAGMNIDETVHFRRKEVVVYPDDEKKPPLGDGLNKKAQITLDCVWPMDKSSRTPVRSPERLTLINYAEKIEETTTKIGGKFIDYRPETGSWVFQVNHFSKYGLLEDSDEDELTEQQKQLLAGQQNKNLLLVQKLKIQQLQQQQKLLKGQKMLPGEEGEGDVMTATDGNMPMMAMDGEEEDGMGGDEEEEDDDDGSMMLPDEMGAATTARKFLQEDEDFNASLDSKYLASAMGVSTQHIQGMKASFFTEEDPAPNVTIGRAMKGEKMLMRAEVDDYDEDMLGMWKKGDKSVTSSLFGAFKHPASLSLPQSPAFFEKEPYSKEGLDRSFQKIGGLFDTATKDVRPTPQTFLHPPVMEHRLIPSGLNADDVPPRVSTQVRQEFVHPKDSLLYRNQEPLLDAACFMGRSFRVGWGHAWTLAHCGFPFSYEEEAAPIVSLLPTSQGHTKLHPRSKKLAVHVEQVEMAGYAELRDIAVINRLKKLLHVQLEHSTMAVEEGCPLIVPEPGVEALHQLAATVRAGLDEMGSHTDSIAQQQMKTVLSLCEALWGNLPDAEEDDSKEIYRESQMRREAVSSWINETSSTRVKEEIEANPVSDVEGCLKAVFSKLSVREISSACVLAQRGRDHHLALLLAQSMGSAMMRHLVNGQLEKWAELDACQFIAPLRHKIYCLLAGQLVWKSKDREINTCEDLDWKRCLALHLWYKCPSSASIQQALNQYKAGFQGKGNCSSYCTVPLPPYLERESLSEGEHIYDTAYHLLCLYADKTYALEALLSPTSSNASHLDFRLSWHLLQILQGLHYRHLSPQHTDSIHTSFASQLEAMGLWEWAAFVLLHIQNGFHRQKAVMELLQRHLLVQDELTDREKFLVEKLLIPQAWLHQAKAVRARYSGDKHSEARHWLLAGHWNNAHKEVISYIAPEAIIDADHDYLREFLDPMAMPEHSLAILNWVSNGKVYLDFMNIRDRLDLLKDTEPTASDLEDLQPQVMSLCGRVKSLSCHTAKDYLCQAKMSKTATRLLRIFLTLQKRSPTSQVLKMLPDLPMPEDYSLQELQALTLAQLTRVV